MSEKAGNIALREKVLGISKQQISQLQNYPALEILSLPLYSSITMFDLFIHLLVLIPFLED